MDQTLLFSLAGVLILAAVAALYFWEPGESGVSLEEDTDSDVLFPTVDDMTPQDDLDEEPAEDQGDAEPAQDQITEDGLDLEFDRRGFYINKAGDPTKVALIVGINKYNPTVYFGDTMALRGCVNDAMDIRKLAVSKGFSKIYYLTDGEATVNNFLLAWRDLAKTLKDGDTLLMAMSRHGMSIGKDVLDVTGDEITGTNPEDGEKYSGDQAAVMHDGVIVDDCFWRLFKQLPKVKLVYINDSCHSATQYRVAIGPDGKRKGRYVAPRAVDSTYLPAKDRCLDLVQLDKVFPNVPGDLKCTLVSVSGCQDFEYSADAYINRRFNGALTRTLIEVLTQKPATTPLELRTLLQKELRRRKFTQTPQINVEGDQAALNAPLL